VHRGGGPNHIHRAPLNDDEIVRFVACPEHSVADGNVLHDRITPEASEQLGRRDRVGDTCVRAGGAFFGHRNPFSVVCLGRSPRTGETTANAGVRKLRGNPDVENGYQVTGDRRCTVESNVLLWTIPYPFVRLLKQNDGDQASEAGVSLVVADPGLTFITLIAEPGSPSHDDLQLLSSWAATPENTEAAAAKETT
jgi:hypothetical protein